MFDGRVFRGFPPTQYFPSLFLFSSFFWSLHLLLPCTCVCSLFWLCVCFSFVFFLKNFGFAVGGQRQSQRLDPHMAGLGQGAGPRLLRGSLCLKPLRISYCSSQGAGWGWQRGSWWQLPLESRPQGPLSGKEVMRGGCEESAPGALLPTASLKFG